MRLVLLLALSASVLTSPSADAAIYGLDDRRDVAQDVWASKMSPATAMLISPVFKKTGADGKLSFDFPKLETQDSYYVCSEEKFAKQPAAYLGCTGFLISPTILITAGHCMVNTGEMKDTVNPQCRDFQWLLDYRANASGQVATEGYQPSQVVGCKRLHYAIFDSTYDRTTQIATFGRDFAIVELDRPITNRPLFKLANTFVKKNDLVAKIGYPLGQAAKVTRSGQVVEVADPEFARTTMDAVSGDSGAPTVNAVTGEVVGILVRAYPDDFFESADARKCQKFNTCTQDLKSCKVPMKGYPVGSQIQNVISIRAKLDELGIKY